MPGDSSDRPGIAGGGHADSSARRRHRVDPSLNKLSSSENDRMHGDRHSKKGRPADAANAPVIDRHLFADPAADDCRREVRFYGRTEGLTEIQADSLTESLPWTPDLGKQAPVLIDDGGGCLDDIGSLREAFHSHDGRLGFSVTGVIAAEGGGKRELRKATHTLLFNEPLFDAVDGFPQGLHMELADRSGGGCRRAPWFASLGQSMPTEGELLPELDLGNVPDISWFRAARLKEVKRLVRRGCHKLSGEDALVHWLSQAYQYVRKALAEEPLLDGHAPNPLHPDLVRLAWLSLPLIDRRRVYYSTTTSETAKVVSVRPSGQGWTEDVKFAERCERRWASLVTEDSSLFQKVARRMDVRRRSLFKNRSGPYILYPMDDVVEMAKVEATSSARRWRALGRVAAKQALGVRDEQRPKCRMNAVLGDAHLKTNAKFFDGMERGLRKQVGQIGTARLAVLVGLRSGKLDRGRALVVEGLQVLGDSPARPGEIEAVVAELVAAVEGQLMLLDSWDERWDTLLKWIWSDGLAPPRCLETERLHALAWAELKALGALTLGEMVHASHPGSANLARHLMGRDPDPPFSILHTLRRALSACGSSGDLRSAHHDGSLPPDNREQRHPDTRRTAAEGRAP